MKSSELIQQMFVSSRPISWINTAFPFAAGYLATGGTINLYFWIATFYFLVPYNFLVYIVNDVFDYESDVKNPRKNSIEGGLLPPSTHKFMLVSTGLFNAIFVSYLLAAGNGSSALTLLLLVFFAVSYSAPPFRLKEKPFFDSINSSIHFVGPLVFALMITGWQPVFWPYVLAFFFWGIASHAFGAVQDILPDREAKIASIATFLGAATTVRFSLLAYVAAGVCLVVAGWPTVLICIPLSLYIYMVLPYLSLRDVDSKEANKGWRKFLWINQVSGFGITLLLLITYFTNAI